MSSKKRRAQRQSRGGSRTGTGNPAVGRRRRSRSKREAGLFGSPTKLLVMGIAVALTVAVAVVIVQGSGSADPNFELSVYQGDETLGGSNIRFGELLGNGKPVVLNFWGGDCPPCRFEMPALQRVYEAHQDEIIFLGLDIGVFMGLGNRQSALDLLGELGITYPAGAPKNRSPIVAYSITGLPATIFFDPDGNVFRRWDGTISEDRMNEIVDAMLDIS